MLEEKILDDYKQAMKDRQALKISVLSFLRAEILNLAVAMKKNKLEDIEVISVIRKQIKQRQDSIEQFNKGGREDLADKENKELEILKVYLPKELSGDEINKIIGEVIALTAAYGMKDMGKVMKEVNARIAGQADGKLISDLVKERLTIQKNA